ncbi:BTAD domain-containing putative transcriptional regulator [Jatrophihabitans fulvus]
MTTGPGPTYRILGPLEVLRDGSPVDLGTPKQRTVLAALLLARGRIVPSDRLLTIVWGEEQPTSAAAGLQVYVSRLRTMLRDERTGVSAVSRRSPGYRLTTEPGTLDADEFTALAGTVRSHVTAGSWPQALATSQQALRIWRGPVLADLGDASWFRSEAETLDGQRVDVAVAGLTCLLALGRPDEAVVAARTLALDAPYRDEIRRLEMLALHQDGRTAEALEAYARYAAQLGDDLGIDPAEELQRTRLALLRQEEWTASFPHERAAVTHGVATADPGPAAAVDALPDGPATASELVGRDHELGVARTLLADMVSGSGRALVLTGPAGIGKTRLAEAVLAEAAARGARAVRGRCLDEAAAPAWWPLREVVRELGADPDTVLDAPSDVGADTRRFAVYERVRDLLVAAAARAPLAMLVDDLQWADPATLGCLAYLTTALADTPVLTVVTVRDAESASESASTTRTVAGGVLRGPGARQVAVPPLEQSDIAALASRIAGETIDDGEARTLAARTQGNPLFVCEYARLPPDQRARGEVPLAVRGVLARRIDTLGDDVVPLLQVAAVIGDVIDLGLLAQVADLPRAQVVDLLDAAADAAIIEAGHGGAGYGFTHALLREEILRGLSPLRRQRLHARVAAHLMTSGGDSITRRARHLTDAGPLADPRELLEACRAAALQAEERTSSETAVEWWEGAIAAHEALPSHEQDPQERDDLLVARVEALVRAGRRLRVMEVVDAGLLDAARAGRTSTAGRLAATLLRASGTWPWAVFDQDPGALIARLSGLLDFVADDTAARVRVLAALGVGLCYDPDRSVPEAHTRLALELAEAGGDPELLADAILGRVLAFVGEATHAEECEVLLERLLRLPRSRRGADLAFAHSARTMSQVLIGDVPGMQRHLRLGVAASDEARLPVVRAQLRWMEVGDAQWHHGLAAAWRVHGEAVEAHRRTELYDAGFGDMVRRMLAFDEGGTDVAEFAGHEGYEAGVWAALTAARTGDRERAHELVAARLDTPAPWIWATLAHMLVLGTVVADLELDDLAAPMLAVLEPHAGRLVSLGQGPVVGPVGFVLARLASRQGDTAAAWRHLATARELCVRNRGATWIERCDRLAAALDR